MIPVNPNEREVEGHAARTASVLDVPDVIDMATVYVQPDVALQLLPEFERRRFRRSGSILVPRAPSCLPKQGAGS